MPAKNPSQYERRRQEDRWHVGREIPLVLIAAVIIQTAGIIYAWAQMSSKLDIAVLTINEFKAERYTREDARRDRELTEQKIDAVRNVRLELERRLSNFEARVERLESNRK